MCSLGNSPKVAIFSTTALEFPYRWYRTYGISFSSDCPGSRPVNVSDGRISESLPKPLGFFATLTSRMPSGRALVAPNLIPTLKSKSHLQFQPRLFAFSENAPNPPAIEFACPNRGEVISPIIGPGFV